MEKKSTNKSKEEKLTLSSFDIEHLFILQDIITSTTTICVVTDSTYRSISDMYKWAYNDKQEMKHLGATISQMEEKFFEYSILGISKMIEDFFNNLNEYAKINLNIWSESINSYHFSKEVRLIRNLGNVIKHDTSIIKSNGSKDSKALFIEYELDDDIPIRYLDISKNSKRDEILIFLYKATSFCYEVLQKNNIFNNQNKVLQEDKIVDYMLKFYVHSIPGHPNQNAKS